MKRSKKYMKYLGGILVLSAIVLVFYSTNGKIQERLAQKRAAQIQAEQEREKLLNVKNIVEKDLKMQHVELKVMQELSEIEDFPDPNGVFPKRMDQIKTQIVELNDALKKLNVLLAQK